MDDARDIIGKTVLVSLVSNGGLDFAGVPEEGPFFCKVVAVDEIGMWVENQNFVTIEVMDAEGRSVPKEKRKQEKHTVNILLPWRNVRAVVAYAEGEGEQVIRKIIEEGGSDNGRIGFVK